MASYGLPYKGSKNSIAWDIVHAMPASDTFVDLFCGGCAVTHVAMLSGKYKKFVMNDIDERMPKFFMDVINGKYHNEKRWISRDDFNRLKDTDAYVASCWSFGNNMRDYLYSQDIEESKRKEHDKYVQGKSRGMGLAHMARLRRLWSLEKLKDMLEYIYIWA